MNRPRRGLVLPAILVCLGVAVLVGLGTWQIERKAWKEALIDQLTHRLNAPPAPLPPASSWPDLSRADAEFRRVTFRAEFLPGAAGAHQARLYSGASALREDVKGPGYFVFAPARTADGSMVVVNRGYVGDPRPIPAAAPPPPPGPVDIVGVLRWPDKSGWFVSTYDAADDLWFVRDHLAMAARLGWGQVAPFYVEMEAPVPPGGTPRPGRLRANLRNEHLQYALTWYTLAIVLIGIFALWMWDRGRRSGAARSWFLI